MAVARWSRPTLLLTELLTSMFSRSAVGVGTVANVDFWDLDGPKALEIVYLNAATEVQLSAARAMSRACFIAATSFVEVESTSIP